MAVLEEGTHLPREASPAPTAGRPKRLALLVGVLVAAAGEAYLALFHGAVRALLFALGLALGVALFHSRFGFTSAWRELVAVGQGKGLRAHTMLLGATAALFALVFATGAGFGGVAPEPSVAPIGIGAMLGALLFGRGMQIGGSCASGTLFAVGSGQTAIVLTLGGVVVGSVAGTWHYDFWEGSLPTLAPYWLADHLGYGGALVVTLLALAAVAGVSVLVQRRRNPLPSPRCRPHAVWRVRYAARGRCGSVRCCSQG